MRPLFAVLLALGLLSGQPVRSESIVTGLSQDRVAITANFDGSEILIYGAVSRDAPLPPGRMDVIITVEGPSLPMTVRKKAHVAGLWINRSAITVDAAPSFYEVATSGPLTEILSGTEDLRQKISFAHAMRAVGASGEAEDAPEYLEALIRLQEQKDNWRLSEGAVEFVDQTLFRADVTLPANLTEGDYRVRLFLLRDGRVVDSQNSTIDVRKAGLERLLYVMAHQQPLLYGIISLLLAVVAGWAASAGARLFRR